MAIERTLAIIKPDAYRAGNMGKIISMIEENGFKIIHARLMKFTEKSAEQFYEQHKGKPFYERLINFTVSDKVMAMVLEKENAIEDFRKLMGDTEPEKAKEGTIRKLFGRGLPNNAIHGSDSKATAKKEITYIFGEFASIPSVEKSVAKEY
ncbi:MAG: nucleoside-diphosphate kinase [Brevinematales bacterium]|nr:nucleoside-diphosphate kinase [Brevinematales bacterium]